LPQEQQPLHRGEASLLELAQKRSIPRHSLEKHSPKERQRAFGEVQAKARNSRQIQSNVKRECSATGHGGRNLQIRHGQGKQFSAGEQGPRFQGQLVLIDRVLLSILLQVGTRIQAYQLRAAVDSRPEKNVQPFRKARQLDHKGHDLPKHAEILRAVKT